jgi:uncharacterized protein (UPF0276 family)
MRLHELVQRDLGIGIGLRAVHYEHILRHRPRVDWFEILSENYMHTGGRPLQVLDEIAAHYTVAMHGVSMNLGGTDPLDRDHLRQLAALQRRCRARWISDHLCWTGVGGVHLHDLLPLPRTAAVLRHLIARVRQAQDLLEQPLVLENASTYLEYRASEIDEPQFLGELAAATGCGLLLDVNNVFVCAVNHGFDAERYLRAVPWQHVVYFHLAGHAVCGSHRVDTHDAPVAAEVWRLYALAWRLSGGRSTLLEWDANVPDFATVHGEALRSRRWRSPSRGPAAAVDGAGTR